MAQSEYAYSIIRKYTLGWGGDPEWFYNLPLTKEAIKRQLKECLKSNSKDWIWAFSKEEFVTNLIGLWYKNVPKWYRAETNYSDVVLSYIGEDLNWALSFMEEPKLFHIIEDRGYDIRYIHKTFHSEQAACKWLRKNTVRCGEVNIINDANHINGDGDHFDYYIRYEF